MNLSPSGYWSQFSGDHVIPSLGPSTRCNWNVCLGRLEKFGRLKWSKVPQKVTRSPAFTSIGMKPSSKSDVVGSPPSQFTFGFSWCCRNFNCGMSVGLLLVFSRCSKYSGLRMNCRRRGSLWDPGRAQRQPFSKVASSRANQSPRQVWRGVVYRKELSWCEWTVPIEDQVDKTSTIQVRNGVRVQRQLCKRKLLLRLDKLTAIKTYHQSWLVWRCT